MAANMLSASMLEKPCQSARIVSSFVFATCSVAASNAPLPFASGNLMLSLKRLTQLVRLFMSHCHSEVSSPLNS